MAKDVHHEEGFSVPDPERFSQQSGCVTLRLVSNGYDFLICDVSKYHSVIA